MVLTKPSRIITKMKNFIIENNKDDLPVIFRGDHNTVVNVEDRSSGRIDVNTKDFREFLTSMKLECANSLMGVHKFHTYSNGKMTSRIDYVWISRVTLNIVNGIELHKGSGVHSDQSASQLWR